jgi:hypothetical protein
MIASVLRTPAADLTRDRRANERPGVCRPSPRISVAFRFLRYARLEHFLYRRTLRETGAVPVGKLVKDREPVPVK